MVFGLVSYEASAQASNTSTTDGCLSRDGNNVIRCFQCGQELPNNGGFCQNNGAPCPACVDMVYDHFDEALGYDVFKFTLEPDGPTPVIIWVYDVVITNEPWGTLINYQLLP